MLVNKYDERRFCMNTPIKTFYFPKTIENGDLFSEWEKEYELESNMPDLQRLIRIDSAPIIESTQINGGNVQIQGENRFNVLYRSSEDEELHSVNIADAFSVSEDIKNNSEDLIPFAKIFCVYISCKVISPRKLYVKAKNKISLSIKENLPHTTPNINESNNVLFFKTDSIPMQTFVPPINKVFNIEEKITVDGTYPPIEKIIFSNVKIVPLDLVKNIGSATLNTTVIFKVFYENNGAYTLFSRSVPVSLTVDDEDINENTLIYYFLTIKNQSVSTEMDNYGEDRILKFEYSPELVLFKIKETVEEIPTDVFSPTEILEIKTKTASFEELSGIVQRPFTVEKVFEIPDMDFSEIYDTSAVIDVEKLEQNEQGAVLNGICGISVLGKTEKGIDCVVFNVNFSQSFPEINDESKKECSVIPIQANATISGRNMINVRVSANATIRKYNERSCTFISEYSPLSSREQRDKSCITLYYPSKSDSVWDIAKEYGIDPKDIIKENKSSFTPNGALTDNIKAIFIP